MPSSALSAIGLTIAAIMSGTNVVTDVARKKALHDRSLIPTTMWCRIVAEIVFVLALASRYLMGTPPVIRDGGALFGIASIHLSPIPTFIIYLVIDVLLVSIVNVMYFRALQISPMSLCIPFLAFTPIFLIPTGYIVLGQLPAPIKLLGVVLIVVGSLAMHRKLFAVSWLAPVKAIVQEKGSRLMLTVALVFSITNPIEGKLVLMSDAYTEAFAYGLGLVIFFVILSKAKREDAGAAIRNNVTWIAAAGLLDGIALIMQLASYNYIPVVISVSIKRAGILLAVFSGWIFFRERGITDKVIAASVMLVGVLILYLPLAPNQAFILTGATLVAMAVALYATRNQTTAQTASANKSAR
ncbi:MAG TPA: hypothetical protein VG675_07020 [Bryobacteraceae bacterium]|nr:hypothetical protein [Bryobacteraceae bacterium]